ncbi:uncharacterized protein JN550_005879 [Neoarthrinium moseri]|uniref:uncharacterized protein n=1 Tax=Neoarthrinium moseri TaxID=1658444 RepID=UPI001FDD21B0|nr:uncharacterized protein JN550_005879 [Neoarthrinium moseri]KAI1869249.1 hypothetical protein JN550_005879 [Neoarthrinium moseri]
MTSPTIAIIGAGPAGCMLARLLTLSNVPVTIYESDISPDYRAQGGTLDLHVKTGLAAIREARLFDEFTKHARYDGDYYNLTDKNFKTLLTFGPSKGSNMERPEIDRSDLRKLLTESLPEGTIKWGRRLLRIEGSPDEENSKTLVFADGSTATGFSLIVGAEGAWSKVRNYLTDIRPQHTGVGYTLLEIPDAATTAPELHKLVRGGNLFSSNRHQRLSVQQLGSGSLHVGWSAQRPENWMDPSHGDSVGYDPRDLEASRAGILREMDGWDPRLRAAVERAWGKCDPKNLYMLPVGWRWAHRPGVTVIGDAAHLMTPFAGEGVNLAFDDARKLARAVVGAASRGGAQPSGREQLLDKAVADFEEDMWVRMEKYQRLTDNVTQLWMFSDDIHSIIPDFIMEHLKPETPVLLHPLAWLAVHGWWKARSLIWG